jgi:hypothetical protein
MATNCILIFQQLLLKYVSGLQVLWRSISVVNILAFMTGKTEYHSPLLRLAGVGLHVADEDMPEKDLSHLRYQIYNVN